MYMHMVEARPMRIAELWNIFSSNPKFFEVKFQCKRCGRCCIGTEMELLPTDIERLLKLGFRLEQFARVDNEFVRLRCVNGHCVFFDSKSKKCLIYEYRPIGCRLYPLQLSDDNIIVDPECPASHTVPKSELVRLAPYVYAFVEFARVTKFWLKIRGLI